MSEQLLFDFDVAPDESPVEIESEVIYAELDSGEIKKGRVAHFDGNRIILEDAGSGTVSISESAILNVKTNNELLEMDGGLFTPALEDTGTIERDDPPEPDKYVVIEEDDFKPFGSWVSYTERLTVRQREDLNNNAIRLLDKNGEELNQAEISLLRQYSGWGGISINDERGVLYDYYTSPPIARMAWKILNDIAPIKEGSLVLEPSCGTGVFFETAPKKLKLTGVELDSRTGSIARLINKDASIHIASFEQFNLSNTRKFDYVVGNAPFGDRTVKTSYLDMPDEKSLDRYFITRSLDNLKEKGTMALIVHPGVMNNLSNEEWRKNLLKKAQFLGGIRLPNSSFKHTQTSVQPDLLFFKKYPEDIVKRLKESETEVLHEAGLYDDEWVKGTYFKNHTSHVMGTVEEGMGQWGSDVVKGEITPDTINAQIKSFQNNSEHDEDVFETIREKIDLPEENKKSAIISLSPEETELLKMKQLAIGALKTDRATESVYYLSNGHNWVLIPNTDTTIINKIEIIKGIGLNVADIREGMYYGEPVGTLQQQAVKQIEDFKIMYGEYPYDDKQIKKLLRENSKATGIYTGLINVDAPLLVRKNIYENNVTIINGHNPAIQALQHLQSKYILASEYFISQFYPENKDDLIREMRENPDIFLTPEGYFQLREDFLSGDVWTKVDNLTTAIEESDNEEDIRKWKYGIEELRNAAGWVTIEEADFTPHSAWIPEYIINNWVSSSDGLDQSRDLTSQRKVAKNENGKWGVIPTSSQRWNAATGSYDFSMDYHNWEEYAHPVIYYLNLQKQRSKNIDTEIINREYNDNFKNYLANHEEFRDIIENQYNRLFNTQIAIPVKTYPININGWLETKTLKGHQWQDIHHLYRAGKGISALGTGFGKTLSAVGLYSVLRQEGRLNRSWFQVPNNKVKDWVKEIESVMPSLKIAFVDPEMPGYSNQQKRFSYYQQIANSEFDILIMPESAASEIQLKPESDESIKEKVIANHVAEKGEGKKQRQVELIKDNAERQLVNGKTNLTIYFNDFACDSLFVDEAHRFKNLFTSSLSRELGLNDGRQSAKALSLFKKAAYIRERNDNQNVFLFTATPLTNSPLEYYNMLMYIAPEELERFGISTIDGFIKNFANFEVSMGINWQNGQPEERKVLIGFKNVQTLQDLFFKYTDFQNDPEKINLEKPTAHNRPNIIPFDKTQMEALKSISDELERFKAASKEEKEELYSGQNYLTFYMQMRTASLDLELYDPVLHKGWHNQKIEKLAQNCSEIFEATKAGQVIFCDRVFSSDGDFNIHEKIKDYLVEEGFKEHEIAIVNGFTKTGGKQSDSAIEKQLSKTVEDYNSGKYKILIGTTACMGEGLNLQDNSAAVHSIDIPYRPGDFIQRNGRVDRQGNQQDSVELHTYMTAGTIDNYSIALVQNKANWISQLLKTKSNVFTNPDDENAIDPDELLLALTEEWGDKEKAQDRRNEIQRRKEEKILDAQNQKRIGHTASLSLLKSALEGYVGDKGSAGYQNRLKKIHFIEKALQENPTFHNHEIINNNEKFLYCKSKDLIIKKGDIIITSDYISVVTDLKFKKQEFLFKHILNDHQKACNKRYHPGAYYSPHYSEEGGLNVQKIKEGDIKKHFSSPSKEFVELIETIYDNRFYNSHDQAFKEQFYLSHLNLFDNETNKDKLPLIFYINDENKVAVTQSRYKYNYRLYHNEVLNPFVEKDMVFIRNAVTNNEMIFDDDGIEKEMAIESMEEQHPNFYTLYTSIHGEPEQKFERIENHEYRRMISGLYRQSLEAQLPWQKEIEPGSIDVPYNPLTGQKYRGIDMLQCLLKQQELSSEDSRFLSLKDIKKLGLTVHAEAEPITLSYIDAKSGDNNVRYYNIYNAKDINGLEKAQAFRKTIQNEYLMPAEVEGESGQLEENITTFLTAVLTGKGYKSRESAEYKIDYMKYSYNSDMLVGIFSRSYKKAEMLCNTSNDSHLQESENFI